MPDLAAADYAAASFFLQNAFMRLLVSLLLLVLSGCAVVDSHHLIARELSRQLAPGTPAPQMTPALRQAAFDQVWTTLRDDYVDPKLHGLDWKAVRTRYQPLALDAASDEDFWKTLNRMAGELNDAHTRVETPAQYAEIRQQQAAGLGIGVQMIDGHFVIRGVSPVTQAALLGVRAGDRLEQVDGEPADAWWQRTLANTRGGSTPWTRIIYAERELNAPTLGKTRTLALQRPDGSHYQVTLRNEESEAPPWLIHHKLANGVVYLRFSGFERGLRPRLMEQLDKAVDAPGVIIDLRSNGGGDAAMAMDLLGRFISTPQAGGHVITRNGGSVRLFGFSLWDADPVLHPLGKTVTAPLAILTDLRSASASELVAGAAQAIGRAQIFGSTSCGCLLGFMGYDPLPGGGALAYSEIDMTLPGGKRIEGVGVIPNQTAIPTAQDIERHNDVALNAALAWLATQKPR
ncbi:S41 family peptidase [Silvimonas sp. JCM 19000]